MKKNTMMRLASFLLIAVLITTSTISGTYAKYVTEASGNDSARVAKWGVTASVSGDLFGATYAAAEDNTIMTYAVNGGTVSSDDATMVVAPGTTNKEGLTIAISGKPEVSTKVIFDAAEDTNGKDYVDSDIYLVKGDYGYMVPYTGEKTAANIGNYYVKITSGFKQAGEADCADGVTVYELHGAVAVTDDYYPLTWQVDGSGEYKNIAAVKTKLAETFINGQVYNPNNTFNLKNVITWSWAYGDNWEDVVGDNVEKTSDIDKQDTILGNMMAAQSGADVKVVVKNAEGTYTDVSYGVDESAANDVVFAYNSVTAERVAYLTVAFNARVTVVQVD